MYTLQTIINGQTANLNIILEKETSKTVISYLISDYDYKIDSILSTIKSLGNIINQHNLFQKPIIELYIPSYFVGNILSEIASKMSKTTKNTFSKLRIIDTYRVFEYNGWDWILISKLNHR